MNRKSAYILLLFLYLVIGVTGCVIIFRAPSIQLPLFGAFSASSAGNATLSAPTREPKESSAETLPALPELPDIPAVETAAPDIVEPEPAEAVETPEPEYTYTAIHKASRLHIRDGASLDANIIGFLKRGDSGDVIRIEGDWVLLKHGELEGYVYKQYLNLEERQ